MVWILVQNLGFGFELDSELVLYILDLGCWVVFVNVWFVCGRS
jgi:hypothetical protein